MKEYYGWQSYNNGRCKWSNYEHILIKASSKCMYEFAKLMGVSLNEYIM